VRQVTRTKSDVSQLSTTLSNHENKRRRQLLLLYSQALNGFPDYGHILRFAMTNHVVQNEAQLRSVIARFTSSYEQLLTDTKSMSETPKEGLATEGNIFIALEMLQRPIIVYQNEQTSEGESFTQIYLSSPETIQQRPITIMLRHYIFKLCFLNAFIQNVYRPQILRFRTSAHITLTRVTLVTRNQS